MCFTVQDVEEAVRDGSLTPQHRTFIFDWIPEKYIIHSRKLERVERKQISASELFEDACINGHLSIMKWIYKQDPTVFPQTIDKYSWIFNVASDENHLDILKWLHPVLIENNIDVLVDAGFKYFYDCIDMDNNLPVAKWIYQRYPVLFTTEKVHQNMHRAFKYACLTGQVQAAKWIDSIMQYKYSVHLKILLGLQNKRRISVETIQLVQWFQSLWPYSFTYTCRSSGFSYLKPESEDCIIDIIIRTREEAKQAKWQHIKPAVVAASNASRNRNSLLYKIPPDVSTKIFGEYL